MNLNSLRKLKNFRLATYYGFEKIKSCVPAPLAKLLAAGNASPLPSAIRLKTYDGSGQAVHPSAVSFLNRRYLACTPYPYKCDAYENPCVYVWNDNGGWTPIPGLFPLVKPEHLRREHYSDPCLFVKNGALHLIFRKCVRRDQEDPADQLYLCSTSDGERWTKPALLLETELNSVLSPAIARDSDSLFCVDVHQGADASRLTRYALAPDLSKLENITGGCSVQGLPEDWFIWHIDVSRRQESIRGLFMLQKRTPPGGQFISKLALFRYAERANEWIYERDIPLSEAEAKELDFIYKSTLIEGENRMICSAQDKKERFFLFEKRIPE